MIRMQTVLSITVLVLLCGWIDAFAQPQLPVPEASQKASVTQTIGISEVQVTYHRPGVKGRPVWGLLVPYGEVWRAGANENTTIMFSTPVKVAGKPLAAGTYGLHMIPTKREWTVIFSTNATSWGSYFYRESEDVLRVTVTPQVCDHREWLQYEFSELTDTSGVLALSWEKLRIPIVFTFDTPALVIANAREAYLRGLAGFSWQGFNQAAQYCVRANMNLAEGLTWADQSIAINENFSNLRTKAAILDKMGKAAEANALRERAFAVATEADVNALGYSYLNESRFKDAIATFQNNVRNYPASWNVYDSLAEALEKSGDAKEALANYQKALSLVRDERNRKRLTDTIARLKSK